MTYINCPQCAQSFNAERDLASLRAQLAAVTTEMTEYRAHLLDEIQNGHGANREAYQRVLDWLAALMEGTTTERTTITTMTSGPQKASEQA